MITRTLTGFLAVVLLASLAQGQVPEGTALLYMHGRTISGDFNRPVNGRDIHMNAMYNVGVLGVMHGGKYEVPKEADFKCGAKATEEFYTALGTKSVVVYVNGNAFAQADLQYRRGSNGKEKVYALNAYHTLKFDGIAATTDRLGGGTHTRPRQVSSEERTQWEALARSILHDAKKIPDAELQSLEHERVTVLNVDGKTEMIAGEFITKAVDETRHQLLLIAQRQENQLKPVLAQYNRGKLALQRDWFIPSDDAFLPYFDILDVDGDGSDEIVAVLLSSGSRILHRDGERWKVGFSNPNPISSPFVTVSDCALAR